MGIVSAEREPTVFVDTGVAEGLFRYVVTTDEEPYPHVEVQARQIFQDPPTFEFKAGVPFKVEGPATPDGRAVITDPLTYSVERQTMITPELDGPARIEAAVALATMVRTLSKIVIANGG